MANKQIPLLKADDIQARVQQVTESRGYASCLVLLYKDARCDMRILDEIYGPLGWKRTHEVIGGELFCNVDIWDEAKGEWVRKQDVGTASNTEEEKGRASDSFKRACVNLGIGRELYTAPLIKIKLGKDEWENGFNGKPKLRWTKFRVREIGYNERSEINKLVIVDSNGNVRYDMSRKTAIEPPKNDFIPDKGINTRATAKKATAGRETPKAGAGIMIPDNDKAGKDAYLSLLGTWMAAGYKRSTLDGWILAKAAEESKILDAGYLNELNERLIKQKIMEEQK